MTKRLSSCDSGRQSAPLTATQDANYQHRTTHGCLLQIARECPVQQRFQIVHRGESAFVDGGGLADVEAARKRFEHLRHLIKVEAERTFAATHSVQKRLF